MKLMSVIKSLPWGECYPHGWRIILLAFVLNLLAGLRFPVLDWLKHYIGDVPAVWVGVIACLVIFPPVSFVVSYVFGVRPNRNGNA